MEIERLSFFYMLHQRIKEQELYTVSLENDCVKDMTSVRNLKAPQEVTT